MLTNYEAGQWHKFTKLFFVIIFCDKGNINEEYFTIG
jgi:hypothetical protein